MEWNFRILYTSALGAFSIDFVRLCDFFFVNDWIIDFEVFGFKTTCSSLKLNTIGDIGRFFYSLNLFNKNSCDGHFIEVVIYFDL